MPPKRFPARPPAQRSQSTSSHGQGHQTRKRRRSVNGANRDHVVPNEQAVQTKLQASSACHPEYDDDDIQPQEKDASHREEDQLGAGRNYFEAHRGAVATTNLTLADLSICSPEELAIALANFQDPLQDEHRHIAGNFRNNHFKFHYFLDAGHSILFYGLGSKKDLLDEFARYLSSTSDVVVIDGFNPTLSLRSTLTQLANDILRLKSFTKRSLLDYVDAIRDALVETPRTIISIAIHNIDGPCLRSADAQHALSRLASLDQIRFVASVDHVNAPLLWDAPMYTAFGWMWIRVDTFCPYEVETFFSTKPLLRGGSERRVEGAVAFLSSLAERSRDVFRELASRQLHANQNPHVVCTTFNELFETVKTRFIVSEPDTLRSIMIELQTHDLLVSRLGVDAAEQLSIPLPRAQLEAVLAEIGPSSRRV